MRFYKLLITILIFSIYNINTYAQKNVTQRADEAFKLLKYSEAIPLYKKAFTKIKKNKAEKARILYQIGVSYKNINDTKNAENYLRKAVKSQYTDPSGLLYLADVLRINEKYSEAIIEYKKYIEAFPSDPAGKNGVESCSMALKWKETPTRWVVKQDKNFDLRESDFAPAWADKKYRSMIFTSSRVGSTGKGFDAWTGEAFTDLWLTTLDKKGKWSTPTPIGEPINTVFSEGTACLNSKANTMYFTRCPIEKKKQLGCNIYVSKKDGNSWEDPTSLGLIPDSSSYSIGHPSISDDELTIYFAGDIPGGQGGKDIWMAKRDKKGDNFGKPINLGPTINTADDEVFPYIRDDGTLYFSSNGYIGLGGLDVYKSEFKDGAWTSPENLKVPLNSAGDDFAIIFEGIEDKGFLSSNRKGGKGGDDIYSFYLPPLEFTLRGVIKDDTTKKPIPEALVKLVGSDGTSIQTYADDKGNYLFDKTQILPNTSYDITVSKEKYFSAKGRESTVGFEKNKDLVHDFFLALIPIKPIVLPEIQYDLAKWDLKPQFQDSLNGLIQTLKDNPTIVIELAAHTDARDTDAKNDTLSQKRAQSVVDYLIQKGIAPDRLVPKGYGERVPRKLLKDITTKDGFTFKKDTVLTEAFIGSLKSNAEREAAHQLNRRTEFSILRTNYVPKGTNLNIAPSKVEIITDPEEDRKEKEREKQREKEREKELEKEKEKEKNKGKVDPKTKQPIKPTGQPANKPK